MNTDLDTCNFSELRDAEIVARMRKCNYEKFKTLVRMHLSFELDLNTDEFDLPCHEIVYEDKGKLKKWNRLSKKHKQGVVAAALATGAAGCASVGIGNKNINTANSQCVNGSPTESLNQQIDPGFLFHLQELKDFIMLEKNLQQEGIFRKTGSASRQTELRNQIQNDKPLDLEASGYSAHDCATVFKGYLADLPEPLLTDAHYPAHLQIAPLCVAINCHIDDKLNEDKSTTYTYSVERIKRELHVLSSIQLLLLLLPDENRQLLQNIIDMLHAVARQHTINKMGPDNLATLFAPHIICPRNLPPEALHYLARNMSSIIAYMIIKGQDIFSVPAKLATDIRAYFLERKRKKTMSPEMALDESISDISTVNTVYTFVDREKTAAAHNTNTTDTELAQLYAHIQTLPESSKKRRLIKQFNKQNGQGTPLQLQAMNRIKNSEPSRSAKSLSDSIKKHIFHKGIMSRTPKRQQIPAAVLETPNNSSMKPHRQRVLFQSPIPQTFTTLSSSALTTRTTTTTSLSLSSTSSTSVLTATIKTPANSYTLYNIKSHPLQKSISSSSLLMSQQYNVNVPPSSNLIVSDDHESSLSSNSTCFSANVAHNHVSSSTSSHSSSDGFVCTSKSISAPVSRQTSTELPNYNNISIKSSSSSSSSLSAGGVGLDSNSCVTPLNLIVGTPAAAAADKKSVAWDDTHISDIERISHPSTPLRPTSSKDLKSRYKSEPNLSICGTPKLSSAHVQGGCYEMITPIAKHLTGRFLTRKLMKGVSMGNLKFPFSTTESTKRLVRNLRRRSSEDAHIYDKAEGSFAAAIRSGNIPLLQDIDDDDDERDHFEDAHCDSETETEGGTETDTETEDIEHEVDVSHMTADLNINTSQVTKSFVGEKVAYKRLLVQQNSLQRRNLDLVTSTPSLLLGRRSMSPITKSTQRMPKAMQESIMTPRSRKPVMVLTTTTSCSDQNQTINQNCGVEIEDNNQRNADVDDEELRDSTEYAISLDTDNTTAPPQPEVINEDATSLDGFSDIFKRRQLLQANQSFVHHHSLALTQNPNSSLQALHNIQNNELKDCTEYDHNITNEQDTLTNHFKEYLLTRSVLTAPPEDTSFTSHSDDFNSSHEIEDVDENQLSSSLLYCLNGNRPEQKTDSNITTTEIYDDANDNTHTNDNSNTQQNLALFKTTNTRSNISTNSNTSSVSSSNSNSSYTPLVTTNRLANNPFVILNNARKRAASQDLEKMSSTLFKSHVESPTSSRHVSYEAGLRSLHAATIKQLNFSNIKQNSMESFTTSSSNKENFEKSENYVVTKKLLISEYSGETSF